MGKAISAATEPFGGAVGDPPRPSPAELGREPQEAAPRSQRSTGPGTSGDLVGGSRARSSCPPREGGLERRAPTGEEPCPDAARVRASPGPCDAADDRRWARTRTGDRGGART